MKLLPTLVVLALLPLSGCCLNADSCTETWGQDGGPKDAAVDMTMGQGGGGGLGQDDGGPGVDGGGDAVGDAMAEVTPDAKIPDCKTNVMCTDVKKPFCDLTVGGGTCVPCRQDGPDSQCDGGRVCGTGAVDGRCVECNTNFECKNEGKPVCSGNACRGCEADKECGGPELCLDHFGGRCVRPDEVIYVNPSKPECTVSLVGEGGTAAKPFCAPQLAVDVPPTKRKPVIILTGTRSLERIEVNIPPTEVLTFVGIGDKQFGPAIDPGTSGNPGILVKSGKVHLRGLVVKGGYGEGVRATSKLAELNINRCLVQDNRGGGILLENGSAFEIANTVVTGNGGEDVLWGGINVVSGGMRGSKAVLRHVTIVDNKRQGLACDVEVTGSGIVSYVDGLKSILPLCVVGNCCEKAMFSSEYKLQSPATGCTDKVPFTSIDRFDVFGQLRSGSGDCGADELDPQ